MKPLHWIALFDFGFMAYIIMWVGDHVLTVAISTANVVLSVMLVSISEYFRKK